ncbi:MAG: hypothetical protein ABGY71_09505 [bacterium]|jgi:hypothetical protein|nr:hypothetical protein [Planctomycetota bacterium]HIL53159.1 hypothetical protein [Planctomycetota bacterium]
MTGQAHGSLALSATLLLCLSGMVSAQWSEDFEVYSDGSVLDGQGSWHGWDGVNTPHARVASQFASLGSQSLIVMAGADSVHEFDGYDSGHWTFRSDVYVPSSFVGKAYMLVMNFYANGGPYQWSVQIGFNGDSGNLECNCGSGTPIMRPLLRDQWTELRCDIDITNDLVEIRYGGFVLGSYPWSAGPFGGGSFGLLQIDAVDLFSDLVNFPHTTELYFDAMELTPFLGSVGTAYCFGDGSGAICPCSNAGAADAGCANSSGFGGRLETFGSLEVPADNVIFNGSQMTPNQPGLLFAGLNAVALGVGTAFGDGLRCAGGSIVRLGVRTANAAGEATWGPGMGAIAGWQAGDTRHFQLWYRDPGAGPCGSGFNLTNGIEIGFQP